MKYRPEGFGSVDVTTQRGATFGRDPEKLRSAWIAKVAAIRDAYNKPLGFEVAKELYESQFGAK